jgi:hypothetical protein
MMFSLVALVLAGLILGYAAMDGRRGAICVGLLWAGALLVCAGVCWR